MKKTYLILSFVLLRIIVFGQTFNPTSHIGVAGTVDTFLGGYTFAYATSGSPWNGAFMSFGGFSNNYDCQISTDYAPQGGNHISFRTRNGDNGTWNNWNELYHTGNINKGTIDFNARTLYSTNVYNTGNIWSQQIKVALANPWPDFVFAKEYQLPTLQETEKHIKDKGHLPGIPSAAEVKANGIDLGEMNARLLQKIEELTLHLIEKDKEIKSIKSDYQELKKMIIDNKAKRN